MNEPRKSQRRRFLVAIALIAALAAAAASAWYYAYGQWYETTENAYLTGNLVEASAEIGGTVVWIGPEQNQPVREGQELLRLAEGDQQALLEQRKSELAQAVQEVLTLRAEVKRLQAEQRLRSVTHELAVDELRRRQRLYPKNMVSKEELDAARTREAETRVAMETAHLALETARVQAGAGPLERQPRVMVAAAAVRTAYRELQKTRVIAPVGGEIARRRVQAGQRVAPGMPLFSIVQRNGAWVEANFKETQLRHMRPGQPVSIRSDLYGDDFELAGTVQSVGTGTGAVFSLLPPQNATGNWIKIVQRVPVRIALDQDPGREHPLPFGASLRVRVDTHDRSGPPLSGETSSGPVADADVYGYLDQGAQELVDRVIREAGDRD